MGSRDHTERDALLADIPPRPFPTYDALPYADFLNTHLLPNTPFLLSAHATQSWPARRNWANTSTAPSTPNLDGLRVHGDQVVPVANTRAREFSEFSREERPLRDVLDLWGAGQGEGLYVKDWHLVAELETSGGSGREVYHPPGCFLDDWLSPPFDAPRAGATSTSTADFRFVYAGPAGTFTPLHADVYGSYSWSANVVGRKVWWLFAPGVERELADARGEMVFDVRERGMGAKGVMILQDEGEVIFVPSGWHHQVVNVDFCISINHNFFASPTLGRVYAALRRNEARCAESITDVKGDICARLGDKVVDGVAAWEAEWALEVDALLERDAGWGWAGFWACVRDNLETPPARPELSPPRTERDAFVRAVLDEYKRSREYVLLPAARKIVDEVERLLDMP